MHKQTHPPGNATSRILIALALVMAFVASGTGAAMASPAPVSATIQVAQPAALVAPTRPIAAVAIKAGPTDLGACVGMISSTQWQVLAFAVGYCPTLAVLLYSSWGRSVTNWIVNGLCRQPWVVWAATRGRTTRC